jgi:hypothetical protein
VGGVLEPTHLLLQLVALGADAQQLVSLRFETGLGIAGLLRG